MLRVQMALSGWLGGPGVNTLYFDPSSPDQAAAEAASDRVRGFFTTLAGIYSKQVIMTLVPEVDDVNEVNGEVLATFAVAPGLTIPGTSIVTGIAPPSLMLLAQYKSSEFTSGRRIAGHSFIGPVGPHQIEADGTPDSESVATVQGALANLLGQSGGGMDWVVWQRPRKAGTLKNGTGTQRDGKTAVVTSTGCPNKFASLRSRRD